MQLRRIDSHRHSLNSLLAYLEPVIPICCRAGDSVVVTSRTTAGARLAAATLREEVGSGVTVHGVACDVSSPGSVARLGSVAGRILGRVDVWINNAGYSGSFQVAAFRPVSLQGHMANIQIECDSPCILQYGMTGNFETADYKTYDQKLTSKHATPRKLLFPNDLHHLQLSPNSPWLPLQQIKFILPSLLPTRCHLVLLNNSTTSHSIDFPTLAPTLS